jgi:hypothetical protein
VTQHYTDWGMTAKHDFIRLFLGKYIGSGQNRDVYEVSGDSSRVVKVELSPGNIGSDFQNVCEWATWQEVRGSPWEKWFAPCWKISDCGIALIQARTTPLPPERYPKVLPDFLCDLKPVNFGLYKGRVVVHDYGLNLFAVKALRHGKMIKVTKQFSSRER